MKAYKLTDENGKTRNNTQWGENVTHSAVGGSKELCSDGWIHFYTHPLIAVIMNPIHANFKNPILWECETSGEEIHESLKSGCKTLTTIRKVNLPIVTLTQRVAFGILCSLRVCRDKDHVKWATKWLRGEDRSTAAYATTYATTYATAYTADAYAADAATAYATAYTAYTADAAYTAATYATAATYTTADATAMTAQDFIDIAKEAMTYN